MRVKNIITCGIETTINAYHFHELSDEAKIMAVLNLKKQSPEASDYDIKKNIHSWEFDFDGYILKE